MSFINDLSHFCSSIQYDKLSRDVIENAKKAIVDTHGVIFTGYKEPVSDVLVGWVKEQTTDEKSTVLGYGFKTSESFAALLNGSMGHATDFDDVYAGLRGHPSIPIYAAVLAICESENRTGKELITAFSIGVEVMSKLGSYMNPSHVIKGWHPTATMGVFGVSAAVGKLYGFDDESFKKVFGLAASMMSGLKINFGTMTKPFHVGYCAKNGIEAAQLVMKGFTASKDVFTPKTGVFDLYTTEEVSDKRGSDLGNPWSIVEPGFNIKRYPCCYATHRFADAALALLKNNKINIDEIESIVCEAAVGSFVPVIHHRPSEGLHGKFSLEYVVSAMLLDKKINMDSFTDEMVNRPTIQRLIPKVVLKENSNIKENRAVNDTGYIELIINTKRKKIKKKVKNAFGSSMNPMKISELKEKFSECLRYAGYDSESSQLYLALKRLEEINDIQEIINYTGNMTIRGGESEL